MLIAGGAGMLAAPLGASMRAGTGAPEDRVLAVLGAMPTRPPAQWAVLETQVLPGGVRQKIEYLSEAPDPVLRTPSDRIRAYLFVPDHPAGARLPAVVAIHQDGPQSHIGKAEPAGISGDPSLFYGLELFRRGYVVICPDRFEHAERRRIKPNGLTSIDPDRDDQLVNHWVGQLLLRGRTAFGKEAFDLMVTADVLTALPYVDAGRIGAIGHSAGGNVLMYFMSCDRRIACGISSCGIFSEEAFYAEDAPKRRMGVYALPGLMKVGITADYLALIAPRPILLTRGLWEWGQDDAGHAFSVAHVEDTRSMVAHAARRYDALGARDNLNVIYFGEGGGNHAFPPGVKAQAYGWLDRNLRHGAAKS